MSWFTVISDTLWFLFGVGVLFCLSEIGLAADRIAKQLYILNKQLEGSTLTVTTNERRD